MLDWKPGERRLRYDEGLVRRVRAREAYSAQHARHWRGLRTIRNKIADGLRQDRDEEGKQHEWRYDAEIEDRLPAERRDYPRAQEPAEHGAERKAAEHHRNHGRAQPRRRVLRCDGNDVRHRAA